MIPKTIFDHIVRTLNEIPVRPIVLIAGDEQQQQPIENIGGKTTTVKSILDERVFFLLCNHFKLNSQHRIIDPSSLRTISETYAPLGAISNSN